MSKVTIAIIAAVSAGAGAAAAAAAMMRLEKREALSGAATATTTSAPTTTRYPPIPLQQGSTAVTSTTPTTTRATPVNPAGLFEYGFPGPIPDLATRTALISSYDRRLRNPHWVVEHITPTSLSIRDGDRKHSVFVEDDAVPETFRAKLKDYFRSGFDRGHQVPAADCKWSQEAMNETFYLSNMCPQVGDGFNRDYWAHLEDFCRRLTDRYPSVRIVTGPLYLPRRDPADGKWYVKYEMIGNPPNVAVPTHFFKVIFAEDGKVGGNVALAAFVLPNAPIPNDKPLADFEVPLQAIERASGLEFAARLPVQRRTRLCAENACALVIKDYAERQKAFAKNGPSNNALAAPR